MTLNIGNINKNILTELNNMEDRKKPQPTEKDYKFIENKTDKYWIEKSKKFKKKEITSYKIF